MLQIAGGIILAVLLLPVVLWLIALVLAFLLNLLFYLLACPFLIYTHLAEIANAIAVDTATWFKRWRDSRFRVRLRYLWWIWTPFLVGVVAWLNLPNRGRTLGEFVLGTWFIGAYWMLMASPLIWAGLKLCKWLKRRGGWRGLKHLWQENWPWL